MALIKCPECGREISDKAISCPECGLPNPSDSRSDYEKLLDNICEKYLISTEYNNNEMAKAIKELRSVTKMNFKEARDAIYLRKYGKTHTEMREDKKIQDRAEKKVRNRNIQNSLQTLSNLSAASKIAKCPKCHSTSIAYDTKKLSISRAVVGNAVAGAPGAVLGGLSSKKGYAVCLNCGKRWKV
jgi:hypothetical protein